MVNVHQPCIFDLLETKMTDHQDLCEKLGFHNHIQFESNGNSGGIAIMWQEDSISITSISISPQAINARFKVSSPLLSCFLVLFMLALIFNLGLISGASSLPFLILTFSLKVRVG